MAIFHCQFSVISRGQGKSSVGASAYRAGEEIYNERDGIDHDYRNKTGVVYKEIHTPDNTPEWAKDRAKLWNEVEKSETRCNSRTAREINIALPKELNREQQIELLRGYVKDNFISQGMIADTVIHDKGDSNPHAHVMLTTREVNQEGFTKKNRDWDKRDNIEHWREQWATHTNRALEKINAKERIDHRSYEEQDIDKVATLHEGYKVRAMERRGIKTDIGNYNREAASKNKMLELINRQINSHEKTKGVLEHGTTGIDGITNRVSRGQGEQSRGITGAIGNKGPISRDVNLLFGNIGASKGIESRANNNNQPRNEHGNRSEQVAENRPERQESNNGYGGRIQGKDFRASRDNEAIEHESFQFDTNNNTGLSKDFERNRGDGHRASENNKERATGHKERSQAKHEADYEPNKGNSNIDTSSHINTDLSNKPMVNTQVQQTKDNHINTTQNPISAKEMSMKLLQGIIKKSKEDTATQKDKEKEPKEINKRQRARDRDLER